MAPNDREDDERELINAEFESMVADLNLDQSSPRTYLDDLDDLARAEDEMLYQIPRIKRGVHGSIAHLLQSISRWWRRDGNDNNDGAVV